jgi:hypothetical protein
VKPSGGGALQTRCKRLRSSFKHRRSIGYATALRIESKLNEGRAVPGAYRERLLVDPLRGLEVLDFEVVRLA